MWPARTDDAVRRYHAVGLCDDSLEQAMGVVQAEPRGARGETEKAYQEVRISRSMKECARDLIAEQASLRCEAQKTSLQDYQFLVEQPP